MAINKMELRKCPVTKKHNVEETVIKSTRLPWNTSESHTNIQEP